MSLLDIFGSRKANPPAPDAEHAPSSQEAAPKSNRLEDLLMQLDAYGNPYVHRGDNGWHVKVQASVAPVGARFEVSSEFGMATPTLAAQQCLDRLRAAVTQLGGKLA